MENAFKKLPEIRSLGDTLFNFTWRKFHQGNVSEILHVLEGEIDLNFEDGRSFHAVPGDILFIPANTLHKDCFNADSFPRIFHIVFSWKPAEALFRHINQETLKMFSPACLREIRLIFDSMRLDHGVAEDDKLLAESRLMSVLLLAKRELELIGRGDNPQTYEETRKKHERLVISAKNYLEKNYAEQITLEKIAQNLEISPFHLSRVFSRESCFSLFEYLTEVRIKEARKLLSQNRYFVSDVAQMVGFEDHSYFSRIFKRVTGYSPSRYPHDDSGGKTI